MHLSTLSREIIEIGGGEDEWFYVMNSMCHLRETL